MSRPSRKPIVAIDGPAGSGKSTVARLLARRLGYLYIDTGAMYRAVALLARRRGIGFAERDRLGELTRGLTFRFVPDPDNPVAPRRLLVDGEDVSEAIRTAEMSTGSSTVSQWPEVRTALVERQRELGAAGGVVMEGRDIGTVVFPDAEVKIFLTATTGERARRRQSELAARGDQASYEEVLHEVAERDRRDTEREHSPLRRAPDAFEFVTDGLTIEQVVDGLEMIVRRRERASG